MEAAEETLTYRDDTGLHRKLLPLDTDKEGKVHGTERKGDESNYVDLDTKPDSAKTVKVSFTSNGNQLSVIKGDGSKQREHEAERKLISDGSVKEQSEDEPPLETPAELPNTDQGSGTDGPRRAEPEPSDCSEADDSDELQYTDMYLNSKTESDDGVSAVLSDHCGSDAVEDESHYITTHEIQLTELDHDVDYDLGRGTYWDFEDDNLVYSFVDYASFESDDTQEGTVAARGRSQVEPPPGPGGAALGAERGESDLCDSDKCASSDESVCKNQRADGKSQLAIRTPSGAPNEPVPIIDGTARGFVEPFGDRGRFSFVSAGARAQYFIPAPGRQHLATKLRRKDINEYSSGASSSISELDDADKEVRNLTAKSFRSLACPYFDAINLSTSSESSVSECGLNKWSAYVDWNYGNVWRGRERGVIAHKTSSATLEMSVSSKRDDKSTKAPQSTIHQASRRTTLPQASSSCQKVELSDPVQPKQRGVTLDLRCDEGPDRGQTSSKNACNEVTGSASGCETQCHHAETTGDTHKRAIFASSLLKNVISKKMQFEQERKMERGEIRDAHPPQLRDQERTNQRGPGIGPQPTSEPDDQRGASCCESTGERRRDRSPLSPGPSVQFGPQKDDDPEPAREAEPSAAGDTHNPAKDEVENSRRQRTESTGEAPGVTSGPQTRETGVRGRTAGKHDKWGKTPEIKICLRNVRETKGSTLNIASLLTPKISFNTVNTLRPADDAKWHILSATEKAPNFTVRDIRDTKCKFQTPIYQVRDVRKLVKSSYRFVSLDNSNSKCSAAAEKSNEKAKKEAVKLLLPSPIVIKCQSVKTNAKSEADEASEKRGGAAVSPETPPGDSTSSHCFASRRSPSKQRPPDTQDLQQAPDSKAPKPRPDRFPGEAALPKQAAIEKLKAAVKTMEQLYEFDRNEWKRKSGERPGAEEPEAATAPSGTLSSRTHVSIRAVSSARPPAARSAAAPASVRTEAPERGRVEPGSPAPPAATQGCSDYLSIPGLPSREASAKAQAPGPAAPGGSPLAAEHPAASIYHQRPQRQQQVSRFSPSVPTGDTVQTQRKMLLDPTTGHYYLVDTPVQAATKRLFDPETGQYVDVPVSQSPVAPVAPVTPITPITPITPVPLSLSPLALSPAAYAHTYMVYPGFIPSPTLPAQAVLLGRPEEKAKNSSPESDYYSPTGDAPRPQAVGSGHVSTRGGAARTERKPVISISTQQDTAPGEPASSIRASFSPVLPPRTTSSSSSSVWFNPAPDFTEF